MKILIIDTDNVGLSFAWRCVQAGHEVKWFVKPKPSNHPDTGRGFKGVQKINNWVSSVMWADLVFVTSNDDYLERLDFFKAKGAKIFAPSVKSANLEISREAGMQLMEKVGIDTAPFKTFASMKEAESHVRKTGERFVFKTMGDNEDKALTYVSRNPADMLEWMKKIRELKMEPAGKVMLQTFIKGIEFGVSRWMGKDGWVGPWNESFEHKKFMSGNHGCNCYSEDTEVLTDTGWKFWPDVSPEDSICTLLDGRIEFERPSKFVAARFDGDMYSWVSPFVDILVTPGHSMYVKDSHSRKEMFFEPANLTALKTRKVLRGCGVWGGADELEQLPSFYKGTPEAWAALVGMFIADGYAYGRRLVFGNCPPHKQEIFSVIAQAAGYVTQTNETSMYIDSKELVGYFQKYGRSWEKYCPSYIKNGTTETIKAFLHGYGTGDGSFARAHNNQTYWTVSERLADDLQELCLKVGLASNVSTYPGRNGNRVNYTVHVSQKKVGATLTPDMHTTVAYSGMVYCCTVTSHIIYVRRNGKALWCGQTGEMGTIASFTKTSKIGKETLGKLEEDLLKLGHLGDTALGFIIDEAGKPWPTEWTCRPGWPIFNMMLAATEGDPAQWMADALEGKDTTSFKEDIGCCLVLASGDFPHGNKPREEVSGLPIYGVTKTNKKYLHPQGVKIDIMTDMSGDKIVERPVWNTAGDYNMVVTGFGGTVKQAAERAYKTANNLHISNMYLRDDVGEKMEEQLPGLHSHGYATHFNYDKVT